MTNRIRMKPFRLSTAVGIVTMLCGGWYMLVMVSAFIQSIIEADGVADYVVPMLILPCLAFPPYLAYVSFRVTKEKSKANIRKGQMVGVFAVVGAIALSSTINSILGAESGVAAVALAGVSCLSWNWTVHKRM